MKNLFALSVFVLMTGFLSAQELTFLDIKDNTLDYGTIVHEEGSGTRVLTIKNTGDKPLIITNAKATCGCTVPSWPKTPILPGKTAEFTVKYATNRKGVINKTVTISSNDAKSPTTYLRVKGEVVN